MTPARRTSAALGGLVLTSALLMGGAALAHAEQPGEFEEQRIALGGDGEFPNYRIPALVQLENGDLLASYDGRPTGTDAPGPNSILQRRSTDGGSTWGEQTVVAEGVAGTEKLGYSDPSYVYDRETGTLFNFHVFSKDTGFWNGAYGNDDADRSVLSASVSVSTDDGRTWTQRSVTEIVKPDEVRATFASSGHGIQIRRGPYAGRLVLQYAGAFSDGSVRAYSVYSDDHGETWQMGTPVGTNMDENKVVELSDGTLMLNSRMHSGGTARYVATSTDGGETWSEPEIDHTLTDPRNNASIIPMNPEAAAGSAEAEELLFSNANSAAGRQNGTVRYSCDDGATWPVATTFQPGATSYSDLVALQDGTFGVLYEGASSEIRYGAFDEEWLQPFCAAFSPATATLDAGQESELTFTVRNDDADTLPAGTATAVLPDGWTADTLEVPALAPGESTEVRVPVTAPASAQAGVTRGEVRVQAGSYALRGDAEITVEQGAPAMLGAQITGERSDVDRDLAVDPYAEGDQVPYRFRVQSTANVAQTVTPVAGNFSPLLPPAGGNCRWRNLPAGDAYNCTTPRHTVTAEEAADGFFVPDTTWELTGEQLAAETVDVVGDEVDLRVRAPQLDLERTVEGTTDVDGDGYDSAGDTIEYAMVVTNTGNVRLTGLAGAVEAERLAVGETLTAAATYTLTAADVAAGTATLPAPTVTAANGGLDASASLAEQSVELDVAPPAAPKPELSLTGTVHPSIRGTDQGDLDLPSGKIARGSELEVTGLEAGTWYGTTFDGTQLGDWQQADAEGTLTVTLPGTRGGADTFAVHAADGSVLGWSIVKLR
ncbi:exo-alpha-sialidase [Brachybacterium vulturis]|uniref:exo-alpha-sialidase n=1 Tax=Brachybacterium vulturis TaxID=2017484 RepID=UPI003736B426